MDEINLSDLNEIKPTNTTARIELLGKYDYGNTEIIDDPYFVSN